MTAFNKVWNYTGSAATAYDNAANWKPISVRNAVYKWTQSPATATEYYLELIGGGSPGLGGTPGIVRANGTALTAGTVGSLAAARWAYGDNDTLGFNTIYIRLADSVDPDSKALDYVDFQQIPLATDHVRLPAGGGPIGVSGLDQASVALGSFVIETGWRSAIGSSSLRLRINTGSFVCRASGSASLYIDLTTSAISPQVYDTPVSQTPGVLGLYLVGSALADLLVYKGQVGLAAQAGDLTALDRVRVLGSQARVVVGNGVTFDAVDGRAEVLAGSLELAASCKYLEVNGGVATTLESAACDDVELNAGRWNDESTGAMALVTQRGGEAWAIAVPKTWTAYNPFGGALNWEPQLLTITTTNVPDKPVRQTTQGLTI